MSPWWGHPAAGLSFPKMRLSFQGLRGVLGVEGAEGKPGTQVPILRSVLDCGRGLGWWVASRGGAEPNGRGLPNPTHGQPNPTHGHVGLDVDTMLDLAAMCRARLSPGVSPHGGEGEVIPCA